jgi:peptidoglycan/LPS O-acetylase OafA/YrhL
MGRVFGQRRAPHIETLRGIACVLLVCVHVVGGAGEGLKLPTGNFLSETVWFFQPLRMPLFAFISGLVFDPISRTRDDLLRKLAGKAYRLLIPLVTVGTLFFVVRQPFHEAPLSDIWKVYFTAYEQFWYLTATFILMTVSCVTVFRHSPLVGAVVLGTAGIGSYLLDVQLEPDWLSITKAFYLAPFFFLGQLFRAVRFESRVNPGQRARLPVLVGLAVAVLGLGLLRDRHADASALTFGNQGVGMLLLSLSLCAFALTLRWTVDWLARIGPYSYAIFLFHLFFTAGSRQIMQHVAGVFDPYVLFAVGMLAGLMGPILVQRALLTQPALASVFLGQRRPAQPASPMSVPSLAK